MAKVGTDRKMTAKGFLHKANGAKVSAVAFLAAHRDWLTTGELASVVSPILAKVDSSQLFPTPALEQIKSAVLSHHMATELAKGEAAFAKANEPKATKNYVATIFDADDNICTRINDEGEEIDLQKDFALPQEAERWVNRRLEEGAPDWRGEVASTKIMGEDGLPMTTHHSRGEAISTILAKKLGPVMNKRASSGNLGFGVKCSPDRNVRSNMG